MDFKDKNWKETVELIIALIELKVTKALYESALSKANELTKNGFIELQD